MDKMEKKKAPPPPPPRFFKPYSPQSKEFYAAMPSTGPLPPIFEPRQIPDYAEESVIFQRLYDELSAAPDVSGDDDIFRRFYDELFAASHSGRVSSKNTPRPQFGSPTQFGYVPPVLTEVALDLDRYGGYTFPSVDLGEASAVDAPAPSGQYLVLVVVCNIMSFLFGMTTGCPASDDRSEVPVSEVAALKIDEN